MAVTEQTNRRINRNRDFKETFTLLNADETPRDLTGSDLVLELRKTVNAADPALLKLTSSPVAGITIINAVKGQIEVVITDVESAALPASVFPYDLYQIKSGGDKVTVLSGSFSVHDSTAI